MPEDYGKVVAAHRTHLSIPEIGRGLLNDESFMRAVKAMIPTNGHVTVEPREYHLKQFCQGEVNRIMAQIGDLTAWQRQVLTFLTAKGVLMQKSEILRALTGKSADQTGGTYKDKYNEIDQLTVMGYLENRGPRWGSQIRETVKERLSVFEATDEDIEQTVATILTKLK